MKNKNAFSLIELSVVLLIIGIIVASIIGGRKLIQISNLTKARALTNSSPVAGIENLALWLETTSRNSFASTAPNDGDSISIWKDINPQQTLKNNATQPSAPALQPTYLANGINGLPTVQFSAARTQFFTINNTIGQMGMDSGEREFFVVFSYVPLSSPISLENQTFIGTVLGGSQSLMGTGLGDILVFGGVAILTVPGNYNYIVNGRVDINGNITIGINQLGDGATNGPLFAPFASNNNFYIGRNAAATPTLFFQGVAGEIIMYNRTLSLTERNDIKNYLSKKWGIKLT